ncbi:MAG: Orotate phosphoribosyltransferase [Syntrophomonadaceae bacterium]|nr:Orotate phosphoribosyltransferase [Bacillota bacterium]MBT9147119.1 Orotate phosphoribosyltransferase [Bacillota bacterium]
MLTEAKKALALGLFDIGAIRFGQFRLKLHEKNPNAPLSPIYIDLRILRSFPDVMDSAIKVYTELTSGLKFDCYADVPTAATPIVAVLSHNTRISMISPRKNEKEHGIKRPIDGTFREGQVALLVDDLITLADSKLETISALEENGLKVHDVVVLVDREQGGVQELKKRGYSCHVAFKLKELLKFYLEMAKITRDQYERTITYL